jgi:type IV pilus assembly protein PilB
VPVAYAGERALVVAMADPANVLAVDDIALMTGHEVRAAVASREDILGLIQRMSHLDGVVANTTVDEEIGHGPAEIVDLRDSADEAPVIKLVNQIIAQAVEQGASDIHMAPDDTALRVRFRIDGVLAETTTVPRRMVSGVISRVKIMSDLDIAEKRIPQDGRVGLTIDGRHIDLRVVTLPSVHGEGAVMRILDKESVVMDLDRLGMLGPSRGASRGVQPGLRRRPGHRADRLGQVHVALRGARRAQLEREEHHHDRGSRRVPAQRVTQVQVNPRAGLTFATGLKSLMRADPDIIMVGEIRDREAAQIAIEAALTGHLGLSTLHTNDAPTAIARLTEMGVEPFLVASAIDCVVAQRLARQLCQHCKRRTMISAELLRENGFNSRHDIEAYEPVGCTRCGQSGYKGRIGIYEVMTVTEEIRSLTIARASADEIVEAATRAGMRRLREDGLEKIRLGRTSLTEVARVTGTGAGAY